MGSAALPEGQGLEPSLADSEEIREPEVKDLVADVAEGMGWLALDQTPRSGGVGEVSALPAGGQDHFFSPLAGASSEVSCVVAEADDVVGEGASLFDAVVFGGEEGIMAANEEAQGGGKAFSSDAQLDEEVDSFLQPEVGEGDAIGGVVKVASDVQPKDFGEVDWSDFKFSQVGSFSDFLSELDGESRDPQPVFNSHQNAQNPGWLQTVASGEVNGIMALGQLFANAPELDLNFSTDASAYWEQTSNQKLFVEGGLGEGIRQEWDYSRNGYVNTSQTVLDKAGETSTDLELPLTEGLHQDSIYPYGSAATAPAASVDTQKSDATTTWFSAEQGSQDDYSNQELYYQDPHHPGWIYCIQTGQWLMNPGYQDGQQGDRGYHLQEATSFGSVNSDEQEKNHVFQEKVLAASEHQKSLPLTSPVHSEVLSVESSTNISLAFPQADGTLADQTSTSTNQESVVISQQVEQSTQGSNATDCTESSATRGAYILDGRGYDPAYPGWYYDYQLAEWCAEESLQTNLSSGGHAAVDATDHSKQVHESTTNSEGSASQTHHESSVEQGWSNVQNQAYFAPEEAQQGYFSSNEARQALHEVNVGKMQQYPSWNQQVQQNQTFYSQEEVQQRYPALNMAIQAQHDAHAGKMQEYLSWNQQGQLNQTFSPREEAQQGYPVSNEARQPQHEVNTAKMQQYPSWSQQVQQQPYTAASGSEAQMGQTQMHSNASLNEKGRDQAFLASSRAQYQDYSAISHGGEKLQQQNLAAHQDQQGHQLHPAARQAPQGNYQSLSVASQAQLGYQSPPSQGQQGSNYGHSSNLAFSPAQYQSEGVVDNALYSQMPSGRHNSGPVSYNGFQTQPWTSDHSFSPNSSDITRQYEQSFFQSGRSSTTVPLAGPHIQGPAFGTDYSEQGWSNGFSRQSQFPSHVQPQQHQHQHQYEHDYRQQQEGQQHMFSSHGQQWGSNAQYGQNGSASSSPPRTGTEAVRMPIGRPPHALCTFGFGGKIVIMKQRDPLWLQTSDGEQSVASGQAWTPSAIQVQNLCQLVATTSESGHKASGSLYFESLTHHTYNGPLVGGSVSSKDVTKWIDERARNCQVEEPDCRNPEALSELWGVLKVMCQHHGKLRSTVGTTGITLQEVDGPEIALASLLTSRTNQSPWTMGPSSLTPSLQLMPSDNQLQVTAAEMKRLLIAGKRKEALQHAREGQLWGPALVLARQLGEKFYGDTVIDMSQRQLVPGSPLRTLSLLLAGQPAEVFAQKGLSTPSSGNTMAYNTSLSDMADPTQDGLGTMMEEWRSNLAIMAANRTSGDDRVMIHLGDCLWSRRNEVEAAHICYLVADSGFEYFSGTARLCLVGADHIKYPRTYVTPEAIQRTELYEHAKVVGNPQFCLPQFQPYKLVYASMLAEAGKTSEALRYCQTVSKSLKVANRSQEVEACRQAATSLEERLKTYTNGGSTAVPKLFQGLTRVLKTMDRGISGMIGGAPPPMTTEPYPSVGMENGGKFLVPGNTSRPPASSLVPSASVEPLSGLVNGKDRMNRPSRSVSEPDFSKSPKSQEPSEHLAASSKAAPNSGGSGGMFARIGSTFFQKASLFVGKSNKNEAKLGDENKFYYNEKLKRWVEEGADLPTEDAALAPPPLAAKFITAVDETPANPSAATSVSIGTPPVPPSTNQFSVRTRQNLRSRYVDTFNKGGVSSPQKTSLSPVVPAVRSPAPPMNFFVPASPMAHVDGASNEPQVIDQGNGDMSGYLNQANGPGLSHSEASGTFRQPEMSLHRTSSHTDLASPPIHRVASVGNAVAAAESEGRVSNHFRSRGGGSGLPNGSHARAASWSGYPSSYQSLPGTSDSNFGFYSPGPAGGNLNLGTNMPGNSTASMVGPYFMPSSSQMEVQATTGVSNASLPLPPAIDAPQAAPVLNGLHLVQMGSNHSNAVAGVALVAEEMQEVEL